MTIPHGQRPLVAALAVLNTVAYGTLYYAQPLLALQFEQAYHWPRSFTSLTFTLALLVTAFTAPALGKLFDAGQGRLLLTLGAGLGALAFALLALTSQPALFMLAWLLAGVAMALTFYEATFAVLAGQLQGEARTRATLSITLVAGLASTIFVPLVTVFLSHIGLTTTLPGRMVFVPALKRWGAGRVTAFLVWVLLLATGLLLLPHHLPVLLVAALLFGLGNGALTLARAELLHAHYPADIFGSVNGKVAWWVNLAQAITPLGMGWLFTQTGSYLSSLTLLTAFAGIASIAIARLKH